MANAVYTRIFDDVFVMTSAEQRIRSSVVALYFRGNTSDVSLWGLPAVLPALRYSLQQGNYCLILLY